MAKFNSSRSKTARNPGPVGRVKMFDQSRSRSGGRSRSASSRQGDPGSSPRSGGPRRRASSNSMNFTEADDYVRMEAPARKGKENVSKHFNPLNFLRADEEDGVVNLPSMDYVEMNDRDFARLRDRGGKKAGRNTSSRFDGTVGPRSKGRDTDLGAIERGRAASGKFMKDFRDAKSARKPAKGKRAGLQTSNSRNDRGRTLTDSAFAAIQKQKAGLKKPTQRKNAVTEGERLQKVLAAAGFGSRRDCEEFIVTGRVMVDREVVTELGTRVLPHQTIHLDGQLVRRPKKFVYYALNKPGNVICSNDDPDGRRRALDFIHENVPGLFAVGRLDLHSEGLLLITNDGELANRLTHPSYAVPKVYRVRVSGTPTRAEIAQICRGVYLAEGLAKAEEVRLRHSYYDGTSVLELTLREGRNREVRRILAKIGHNVLDLVRVSIGDVKLGKLPLGAYRPLTSQEVRSLKKLVGLNENRASISASSETGTQKVKDAKDAKEEKAPKTQKVQKKSKKAKISKDELKENTVSAGMEDAGLGTDALQATPASADALYEAWKAEMNVSESEK